MNVMRVAVAVILFTLPLVYNRKWMEDRFAPFFVRLQVLLLEMTGKFTQRYLAAFQVDLVGIGRSADIR